MAFSVGQLAVGRPGPGRLIDLLVSRDPSSGQAIAPAVPGTPGSVWPGPQGHRRSSRAAARAGSRAAARAGHADMKRRPPVRERGDEGDRRSGIPLPDSRGGTSRVPAPARAMPAADGLSSADSRRRRPHAPTPLPARSGTAARGLPGAASRGLRTAPGGPEAPLPAGPRRGSPRTQGAAPRGLPHRSPRASPSPFRGSAVAVPAPRGLLRAALLAAGRRHARLGLGRGLHGHHRGVRDGVGGPVTVPVCRFAPSALTSTSAP